MANAPFTISASQVSLDAHASIRQAIEKANVACLEVARLIAVTGQPVGENLLGINTELLKVIGNMPKSKLMPILTTGVPIFELRFKTLEIYNELMNAKGFTSDKLFGLMMMTFDPLPELKLSE